MIAGIIAEFNPLHKGHEALINFVKGHKNFEACIAVLSSNFTQRGSPAFIDKFTRAKIALKAGADLVIELPFMFSCSAGHDFARGAVDISGRTKIITHLAFGMEDADFDFMSLVNIMMNESSEYKCKFHECINAGMSYAKAYSYALEKILPGSSEFISKPNNMLAVSYIMNIIKNNYNMKILPVSRTGNFRSKIIRDDFAKNIDMLPEYSQKIIIEAQKNGRLCSEEKLWPFLQNIFIRSRPEDLRKIYGIDEGIEGLFLKHWRNSESLNDFIGRCVCARYTRSHIRRRLVYILLNIDRWEAAGALRSGVNYARVLAFNDKGRKILRECAKNSELKFITRLKDSEGRTGKFFADLEFKASQLYELLMQNPDMNNEMQKPVRC